MDTFQKAVMLNGVQSHLLRICTGESPESVYTALSMNEGIHLTDIGPIELKDGYNARVFINVPEADEDLKTVTVNTVLYDSDGNELDEDISRCLDDLSCIILVADSHEFDLSLNLYEAENGENRDPYAAIKKAGMELSQDDRSELFGSIIDIFEDWLDSKGITPDMIPNEDREGGADEAIIYGEDYDYLCDRLSNTLGIQRYV